MSRSSAGAWLLIVLACAFQVYAPSGLLSILARAAGLSFDNPTTQALDDLSDDTPACEGPLDEAREFARRPPDISGFAPDCSCSSTTLGRLALSSRIPRSPPDA
jgi:hypothetical protein